MPPTDPADPLPSLFLLAELLQHFRFTPDELREAGLEERDFARMLARLRMVVLRTGWVLVE